MICNAQNIDPMPVIIGAMKYPDDIINKIKNKNVDIISVDAAKFAAEAGNLKTVNVVLIGLLSKYMNIPEEQWINTLKSTVPEKVIDVNLKAFQLGRSAQ